MTSKEALAYLTSKVFTGGNTILETESNICADIIKQDLERLEALEKENKELKETIEIRKQMNINLIDFSTKLKQENEKLKKAFKILTQRIIIKTHKNFLFGGRHLDIANTTMKLTDEEYKLIKEVVHNESNNT